MAERQSLYSSRSAGIFFSAARLSALEYLPSTEPSSAQSRTTASGLAWTAVGIVSASKRKAGAMRCLMRLVMGNSKVGYD